MHHSAPLEMLFLPPSLPPSVIVIGFEDTELTVAEEQGSVTLNVTVFEGGSDRPVTVLLSTEEDTAIGTSAACS